MPVPESKSGGHSPYRRASRATFSGSQPGPRCQPPCEREALGQAAPSLPPSCSHPCPGPLGAVGCGSLALRGGHLHQALQVPANSRGHPPALWPPWPGQGSPFLDSWSPPGSSATQGHASQSTPPALSVSWGWSPVAGLASCSQWAAAG